MDNKATVSDLVAGRVREVRTRRGLSTAQLAAQCADLGAPGLTAQALYKLQEREPTVRRPRSVTVDELLVLALALNVAPVHLLVPPDDDDVDYPVTATVGEPASRVRGWVRGLHMLRRLPRVGDQRLFFTEVPADEFDAVQQGRCSCCGGRQTRQLEKKE